MKDNEELKEFHFPVGTYEYARQLAKLTGALIAREGWNGSGMYLAWQPGTEISPEQARGGAAKAMAEEGIEVIKIGGHMDMRTSGGTCAVGWVPTNEDHDASDWIVLPRRQ